MSKKKQSRRKKRVTVRREENYWKYLLPLLGLTVIAFFPVFSADFVNWDDPENLLKNPYTEAFTWSNISSIFHPERGQIIGNYNPLPILTFTIERALFGLNPVVYHTTNLLLHLLTVYLVFRVGQQLKLPLFGALVLAALFAIHPMRVESVAWVTERKDVLFATLYFGAIFQWLKLRETKQKKHLVWMYVLFALSLFAKIQAVVFPLSLLAIDYLQKRPLKFKLIVEKIPLFAGSLAFGLFGIYALSGAGSLDGEAEYGIVGRLLVGAYSYMVYLFKAVLPYEMAPLYPYPGTLDWKFYLAPLGIVLVGGFLWYAWKRNWRTLVFGLVFFTFNIMFLLQVLGAGQGFIADRFTYVAYFGLFFAAAYYFEQLIRKNPARKTIALGTMGALLLVYFVMTFQQSKIWENGVTLWTHELKKYDDIHTPYHNLGHWYRDEGDFERALGYYNQSIEVNGDRAESYNSRGKLYFDNGRTAEALQDYNRSIEMDPSIAEVFINRGAANGASGNMQQALSDFNEGLKLDPDFTNGYRNRSVAHIQFGNFEAALEDIKKTVEARPNDAPSWTDMGYVLNQLDRPAEAFDPLNRAIALDPQLGNAYLQRSRAYYQSGDKASALRDAQQAQQLGVNVSIDYLNALR